MKISPLGYLRTGTARTTWTTMMSRTSVMSMLMLLLELFVLLIGKDTLQLLVILLALFHLLFHLGLLFVGQLRALLLVLLGSTGLCVRTGTARTPHGRTAKHVLVLLVQSQHLRLLVGCQS